MNEMHVRDGKHSKVVTDTKINWFLRPGQIRLAKPDTEPNWSIHLASHMMRSDNSSHPREHYCLLPSFQRFTMSGHRAESNHGAKFPASSSFFVGLSVRWKMLELPCAELIKICGICDSRKDLAQLNLACHLSNFINKYVSLVIATQRFLTHAHASHLNASMEALQLDVSSYRNYCHNCYITNYVSLLWELFTSCTAV